MQLTQNLAKAAGRWFLSPYVAIMFTTGPMYLTTQYAKYMLEKVTNSHFTSNEKNLWIRKV